jgi:hypothetical protein
VLVPAALLALGASVVMGAWRMLDHARGPWVAQIDGLRFVSTLRHDTAQQRAGRLAFSTDGRVLAVTGPRYNRLSLLELGTRAGTWQVVGSRTVELAGRPVAVAPAGEAFLVLQRPAGDARHLEAGFLQTVTLDGRIRGPLARVGFDPDDLAISADGKRVLVLLSGHAEGETGRPDPSLVALEWSEQSTLRPVAEWTFDRGDDPERLALEPPDSDLESMRLVVSMKGSNRLMRLRYETSAGFAVEESLALPPGAVPGAILADRDHSLLVVDQAREQVLRWDPATGRFAVISAGHSLARHALGPLTVDRTRSTLELLDAQGHPRGQIALRGPWGLGQVEPIELAVTPRGLAVADRSGGVHVVGVTTTR